VEQVEAGRVVALDQTAPRDRAPPRLAGAVRRLVEAVDDHRVVRGRALEPVAQVRRALVVGVAAGVDDERAAVGGDLDRQEVVVAVAAVAERAAVEDQEALVRERAAAVAPAAALDVVAAVREARVAPAGRRPRAAAGRGPAQVLAPEQVGGQLEQVRVASAVAVR
jgi:hypothetical protein